MRSSLERAWLLDLVLGVPLGRRLASPAWEAALDRVDRAPSTFVLGAKALGGLRALVAERDDAAASFAQALRLEAAAHVDAAPPSVVDKGAPSFGADLHDYCSLARYYWPDPTGAAGAPYVRRDGQVNPEAYDPRFDAERLADFSDRLVVLAVAAYVLDDERFARAAERWIRVWFLEPASAQTPHFAFAQVRPGVPGESGYGLIEARRYVYVCDVVALLQASGYLDARTREGFRDWIRAFDGWVATSTQGAHAARATNNIGFWVDVQRCAYAAHLGRRAELRDLIQGSVAPRLVDQVGSSGALLRELDRARPHDYAVFTLLALAELGAIADHAGIRIGEFSESAGRSYHNAFEWFSETLAANGLGDRVAVLQRVAENQRTIAALRSGSAPTDGDSGQADGRARSFDEAAALLEGALLTGAFLRDQGDALRDANAQVEALSEDLERARAREAQLERRLEASTKTLSDLRSSASWRITGPLRSAKGLAHDVRRGAFVRRLMRRFRRGDGPAAGGANDRDPLSMLHAHVVPNEEALIAAYAASASADEPDTFALVRVIGNDLYPRHRVGQSRDNVAFILEHEGALEDCERAWVLNRIIDPDEERAIVALLEAHDQPFLRLPFDVAAYRRIGFDHEALPSQDYLSGDAFADMEPLMQRRLVAALYRHKNRFVMHNNGARNAALAYGREFAKWVLPWDGNCFVPEAAWRDLCEAVRQRPHLPYFVTPMQRIERNEQLLAPGLEVHPAEEPQVLFRRDAGERFDEAFPYGRRPKVELFWRLGVPGPWDRWRDDPWDVPRNPPSSDAGAFGVAGWVARLASGVVALERSTQASFKHRGRVRQDAILATIDRIDGAAHGTGRAADPEGIGLVTYEPRSMLGAPDAADPERLDDVTRALLTHADEALTRGPYAVTNKTTLPPSRDAHDYWHPAPYWWPDPSTRSGLPYVKRDGERVPGTRMYEPDSVRYDRTSLQRCFDDATALALAGEITDGERYRTHAAGLLRAWFLERDTAMRPHLRYAQVRMGHNRNVGYGSGIIELKDVYYALDAVRLLARSGALSGADVAGLQAWFEAYRVWLVGSEQGRSERSAQNNHGTYYDLQLAAIDAFLGDTSALRDGFLRAEGRIAQQVDALGEQPHERARPISAHYYLFNAQGWLNLLSVGSRFGFVPATLDVRPYDRLARAVRRVFEHADAGWPHPQRGSVDWDRLAPLASTALRLGHAELVPARWRDATAGAWRAMRPTFDPHDGIAPYWNLAWRVAPLERGRDAASFVEHA